MFDELKEAFRQAVQNFKTELNRDSAAEAVSGLLGEMRKETIDAEAYLRRLRSDLEEARDRAVNEGREASTCRRREAMARSIDDEETARIAGEFAERHESRKAILDDKVEALEAEVALTEREVAEMKSRLKRAISERDSLSAQAGRARTRDVLRDQSLFGELDRMEEKIDDESRFADALGLDERLDALKQKMREESSGPESPAPEGAGPEEGSTGNGSPGPRE